MWQQRDKMFSRWKERFFILTSNYLQCFKKGTSRITEMGGFIFKLRLSEVRRAECEDDCTEFPIPSCREVFRIIFMEFPRLVGRYCS